MKIKSLEVGPREPCRIIAELGTLHLSSYDCQMQATVEALKNGADMVKTQLIDPSDACWATEEQRKRYYRLNWSISLWIDYFKFANFKNEEPIFASIFSDTFLIPELLKHLPAIKLGHKLIDDDNLSVKLIETGKPLFISVGSYLELIKMSDLVKERGSLSDVEMMFVQSIYPTPCSQAYLPTFWGKPGAHYSGLSCHLERMDREWDKRFLILRAAMLLGATVIEVHVKGEGAEGPDAEFALTMSELNALVMIRNQHYMEVKNYV